MKSTHLLTVDVKAFFYKCVLMSVDNENNENNYP